MATKENTVKQPNLENKNGKKTTFWILQATNWTTSTRKELDVIKRGKAQ